MLRLIFFIVSFALLLAVTYVYAGSGYTLSGGAVSGEGAAGGGPSALYTAATAIWDFENNGSDTKGTHNLTAYGSPTYDNADKKQGDYAVDLNGTDQYFNIADTVDLDLGGTFSIAYWYNSSNLGTLLDKRNTGGDGEGYRIYRDYTDRTEIRFYTDAGGGSYSTTVPTPAMGTGWYHCVWVHDTTQATEDTVWISEATFGSVVNGTTYNNDVDPAANSSAFSVGVASNGSSFMAGSIDELIVWKGTAITATDAENIYNGSWR